MTATTRALCLALGALLTAACVQHPHHQPQGEDPPFETRSARQREIRAQRQQAHQAQHGPLPRAEDPAMQNIRVTVTHIDEGSREFERFEGLLAYDDGTVRARAGSAFADNGFTLAVAGGNLAGGIGATSRSSRYSSSRAQMLMTLNGHPASMRMDNIDRRLRVVRRTPRGEVAVLETAVTGASLAILPEIVDPANERVRVTVWPELADERPDGSLEVQRIQSTVVLQNGQTLVLGGMPEAHNSIGKGFFTSTYRGAARRRIMLVTVQY